jgi:hypothetical protein
MSEYERVVDAKGVVRYKLDGKFVKASEVPEDVKVTLNDVVADDPAEEPVVEEPTTEVAEEPVEDPGASPDDVDDESGIDEEVPVAKANLQEEGMGFKRVDGKTVDVFDGKTPHDAVRYVGGLMVPLSKENFEKKTDAEILARLKKLGKL